MCSFIKVNATLGLIPKGQIAATMLAVRGARGCAATSTVRPRLAIKVMKLAACRALSTAAHPYDYDLVILGMFPAEYYCL